MPLYDMQCEQCGQEREVACRLDDMHSQTCQCGGKLKVLITNHKSEHWFKPHMNDGFTGTPIEVRSLKHYKELCIKHGVVSRATGDCRNYTHQGRHGYDIEQS